MSVQKVLTTPTMQRKNNRISKLKKRRRIAEVSNERQVLNKDLSSSVATASVSSSVAISTSSASSLPVPVGREQSVLGLGDSRERVFGHDKGMDRDVAGGTRGKERCFSSEGNESSAVHATMAVSDSYKPISIDPPLIRTIIGWNEREADSILGIRQKSGDIKNDLIYFPSLRKSTEDNVRKYCFGRFVFPVENKESSERQVYPPKAPDSLFRGHGVKVSRGFLSFSMRKNNLKNSEKMSEGVLGKKSVILETEGKIECEQSILSSKIEKLLSSKDNNVCVEDNRNFSQTIDNSVFPDNISRKFIRIVGKNGATVRDSYHIDKSKRIGYLYYDSTREISERRWFPGNEDDCVGVYRYRIYLKESDCDSDYCPQGWISDRSRLKDEQFKIAQLC